MADRQPGVPSQLVRAPRRDRGVVLLVVLFFALLLTGSIATFLKRSTVDAMIARNRENSSRARTLAGGGLVLAQALLIQDRLHEDSGILDPVDTYLDSWAMLSELEIETGGGTLEVTIEDTGARLNLNALFEIDDDWLLTPHAATEQFLIALLEKVIDEMPISPAERGLYEPRELAANLIDWMDGDEIRLLGGPEDAYYQEQEPPYRAANRPLLSVEELRLVEGFDGPLVEALQPYVTVYPFAPGGCGKSAVGCGINLNTAPPHVLATLFYDDGVTQRLATEDVVRRILEIREDGRAVCSSASRDDTCTPMNEIVTNAIFPPPTFSSEVFVVTSVARVGEVRRVVEAVIDRSLPAQPRLLFWQTR